MAGGDRAAVAAAIGGCKAAELFQRGNSLTRVLRETKYAEEAAGRVGLPGDRGGAAPEAPAPSDRYADGAAAAKRSKLDEESSDPLKDALCNAVGLRNKMRRRKKQPARGAVQQAGGGADAAGPPSAGRKRGRDAIDGQEIEAEAEENDDGEDDAGEGGDYGPQAPMDGGAPGEDEDLAGYDDPGGDGEEPNERVARAVEGSGHFLMLAINQEYDPTRR